MKDLHVQDSGIGNTIYALLHFHFKTTLSINYIDCRWCDIYLSLQQVND
jgi:hypothetical protein